MKKIFLKLIVLVSFTLCIVSCSQEDELLRLDTEANELEKRERRTDCDIIVTDNFDGTYTLEYVSDLPDPVAVTWNYTGTGINLSSTFGHTITAWFNPSVNGAIYVTGAADVGGQIVTCGDWIRVTPGCVGCVVFECDSDVSGQVFINDGVNYNYTFTSNLSDPTMSWTSTGGINFVSSTNTNSVTINVDSSFVSGSLTATGTEDGRTCTETIEIFRDNQCPTPSNINIIQIEQCADFQINLTNANEITNVNWYYSIGPYSHVYFGSSTNPNGNYNINIPFHLNNSRNWDDYILYIYAEATLENGVTCAEAYSTLRLDCDQVIQINK